MTRFPTIRGGFGTSPGQIRVPSGALPFAPGGTFVSGSAAEALGVGLQQLGRAISIRDERLKRARDARMLTQNQVADLKMLSAAGEEALKAPAGNEEAIWEQRVNARRTEIEGIEDERVRLAALNQFDMAEARGRIALKQAATKREVIAEVQSLGELQQTLVNQIATGHIALDDAVDQFSATAKLHEDSLGKEHVDDLIGAFEHAALNETFAQLLEQDPEAARDMLSDPRLIDNTTPDQRREMGEMIDNRTGEVGEQDFNALMGDGRQVIRNILDGNTIVSTDFLKDTVADIVEGIEERGWFPGRLRRLSDADRRDALTIALLEDELKLASTRGNGELSQDIADALPNTVDANLLIEDARGRLQTALRAETRQIDINAALRTGQILSSNANTRAAVDIHAQQFAAERMASPNPPSNEELILETIQKYGPIGLLPSNILDPPKAIIMSGGEASDDSIRGAMSVYNQIRLHAPIVFHHRPTLVPGFIRDRVEAYLERNPANVPISRDPSDMLGDVESSFKFSPIDVARARGVESRRPQLKALADSEFNRLASRPFPEGFGLEDFVTEKDAVFKIDESTFGRIIPFELMTLYQNEFESNVLGGMEPEDAALAAFNNVKQQFGPTRVLRDEPIITASPPEQIFGDGTKQVTRRIENDIAFDLATALFEDRLVMLPGAPPLPEVEVGRAVVPTPRVQTQGIVTSFLAGSFGAGQRTEEERLEALRRDMLDYARENLEIRIYPSRSAISGDITTPIYQVFVRRQDGGQVDLEPVWQTIKRPNEEGQMEDQLVPFLINPAYEGGWTSIQARRAQEEENEKALRLQRITEQMFLSIEERKEKVLRGARFGP